MLSLPKVVCLAFESYLELRCRDSMVLGLQDMLSMLNHVYTERLALVHLLTPKQYKTSGKKNLHQIGNP